MPELTDVPVAYVIIADGDCMRWQFYERELAEFWRDRDQQPSVHRIGWQDVIKHEGRIEHLLPPGRSVFRIESPGRVQENAIALRRLGQRVLSEEPIPPCPTKSWIVSPRLVYSGLCKTMDGLTKTLRGSDQLVANVSPSDIAILFDKNQTTARLIEQGLPCPGTFEPQGSGSAVIEQLQHRGWKQAFVKLAFGSCASGIVMVSAFDDPPSGVTTVVEIDGHFHNTHRVQRVEGEKLERLLDYIVGESATVQQAVPKATIGGQNFDVRVVVAGDSIVGTIFRSSPHPMTNLHLGGRRADPAACLTSIPNRQWLDAIDHCVSAAGLFEMPSVGIDVAFERGTGRPFILEINAFGDFFPNWTNADGRSVHASEIEATARQLGLVPAEAREP